MHVTIVLAVRNRSALLPCAVDAALAQSHRALDVVVVDDGSSDGALAALADFRGDPRVTALRLGVQRGAAVARNLGLLVAEGEAVSFHDADDVPARDKIEAQLAALAAPADPGRNWQAIGLGGEEPVRAVAALAGHLLVRPDGAEVEALEAGFLAEDMLPNLPPAASGAEARIAVGPALFRREVFERLGGFADSLVAGRDLMNRIIASGGVLALPPRPLYTRFERPEAEAGDEDPRHDADLHRARARLAPGDPARLGEPIDLSRLVLDAVVAARPPRARGGLPVRGFHPSLAALGLAPPAQDPGRPALRRGRVAATGTAAGIRGRSAASRSPARG